MNNPIVTFSYDQIDRMFFERIRKAVVNAGYLPDITLFPGDPTGYQAAKDAIKAGLGVNGRLIDIIGTNAWDDTDNKESARIVIKRNNQSPGSIADGVNEYFTPKQTTPETFSKHKYPDRSDNLSYEVRLISDRIDYERILQNIVDTTFRRRSYYAPVDINGDDLTENVLVVNEGVADISDQHYLEKIYRYTVVDVFLGDPELTADNIPLMTTLFMPVSVIPFLMYGDNGNIDLPIPETPNPPSINVSATEGTVITSSLIGDRIVTAILIDSGAPINNGFKPSHNTITMTNGTTFAGGEVVTIFFGD